MRDRDSPFYDKKSVRDEAFLLLSIADIARCEIIKCPNVLQDSENEHNSCLPMIPILRGVSTSSTIENYRNFAAKDEVRDNIFFMPNISAQLTTDGNENEHENDFSRLRTVSIDSPAVKRKTHRIPDSPIPFFRSVSPSDRDTDIYSSSQNLLTQQNQKLQTPIQNCQTLSDSSLLELNVVSPRVENEQCNNHFLSGKHLQGDPPNGASMKKIARRKFSWKNYPELEHFLVANRQEYLRHSALNYTTQQKQYNNRLTERLLELATETGYIFDEDFNFVTVRDRIRCYYKSFVQSAKKRGILMGYAARKAGISSED